MTEKIGAAIKEARTAAGMTQKALAEAVDGVSSKNISEAERGLRELTEEQLEAIAKATGADKELFGIQDDSAPAKTAAAPSGIDKQILELLSAADSTVKKAALGVLQGETSKDKGLLDDVIPMIGGMFGGNTGTDNTGNPLFTIIGFLASSEGKAFLDTVKGVIENIADTFGLSDADGDEKDGKTRATNSMLAFTFFYTVAIYILLIGFFYWQGRDDKPAEQPDQ